jgi:GT2 family glycosyltransferase
MQIDKLLIYSATTKNDSNLKDFTLYKSIENLDMSVDLIFETENVESLAVRYNQAIKKALDNDYDALILVHDDVKLEIDPTESLEINFENFDVIGVAGTSKVTLQSPALWHLMGSNLHGFLYHDIDGNKFPTNFGPYPHRVVMIDGVFMALNRKAMETVKFDETNPCKFHFYDLDYSMSCHLAGLKVGVGNSLITHESPGLREFTDEWETGNQWFLQKYNI